jgi:hypothetical protein
METTDKLDKPDTDDSIRQVTRYGVIRAKAVEIVSEGPWEGVWSDTCVWHESDENPFQHIIGYVRIVTNATDVECVAYRQNKDDDDTLRRLYVSSEKPLMSQLRSACEILLLMHVHDNL